MPQPDSQTPFSAKLNHPLPQKPQNGFFMKNNNPDTTQPLVSPTHWHRRLYRQIRVLQAPPRIQPLSTTEPPTHPTAIVHKPHTNPTQSPLCLDSKPDTQPNTKPEGSFTSLVGIQYKILFFLFELCQKQRSQTTPPLTVDRLAEALQIPKGSIKTTVSRLLHKGWLQRHALKAGRGGWSVYRIEDPVYQELLHAQQQVQRVDSRSKSNTQPDTSVASSSSHYNKNTTTTWKNKALKSSNVTQIDSTPLSFIGFTDRHVAQILQKTDLTEAVIQESIHAFAFDLRTNHKSRTLKKAPLDFFMGILSKGPYLPPPNYALTDDLKGDFASKNAPPDPDPAPTPEVAQKAAKHQAAFESWLSDPVHQHTFAEVLQNLSPDLRKVRMLREAVLRQYFDDHLLNQS